MLWIGTSRDKVNSIDMNDEDLWEGWRASGIALEYTFCIGIETGVS